MQFKCRGAGSEQVCWVSPTDFRRKGMTKGRYCKVALDPSCMFSQDLSCRATSFFFSRLALHPCCIQCCREQCRLGAHRFLLAMAKPEQVSGLCFSHWIPTCVYKVAIWFVNQAWPIVKVVSKNWVEVNQLNKSKGRGLSGILCSFVSFLHSPANVVFLDQGGFSGSPQVLMFPSARSCMRLSLSFNDHIA